MKFTKKCDSAQHKISIRNRRCSSAGMFYTSSAGAVTSLILMLALPFIFGLTGATNLLGLGGSAHATVSTLTISVTDSVSLDMASSIDAGNFAHSDTSANNVSIITNNGTGYTLGIKAKANNSNALINSDDTSKTIPSITTSISESTYASSSSYNNTWGFRPSKLNSAVNENYIQAPTSASTLTTLDQTTSANPSTANNYNLAIGARINSSTTPGSYSNVFVLTVTANPIPYTITYNKNTTDTVTNMPANTSSQAYDETVNISDQVPARDGYNFKGWCTVQVADGGTCTGTTYNPDGGGTALTWTLDQTISSNSLSIYAMWESADPCIGHQAELYCKVAAAWKSEGSRVLTNDADANTGIKAAITTGNSGVFKYNPSTFGTASDAANTSDIYFYRGILDNTTGTYGSNGDNAAHPNTVVLSSASSKGNLTTSDTCWRIVRTTGSGGVKMIYQGKWTGSTCANATTKAQVTTNTFSVDSSKNYGSAFGYTQNGSYNSSNLSATYSTMFGSNTSYSANSTNSGIKGYIENTWFTNINSFASKLEPSAGYCNDRTLNSGTSWTTPMSDSTTVSTSTTYYAGAYIRNMTTTLRPSLTCSRSGADLYTTSSASNGNKQLSKPAALITADEASFAGSGRSNASQGSSYHANSFLRSGSDFWLLSPGYRNSKGYANGFYLISPGYLYSYYVSDSYGVRPAISLKPGSMAVSGSGTAADPWIVNPPKPMQEFTASDCSAMSTGQTVDLVDSRDGEEYKVGKLADGKCWMLDNLRLGSTSTITLNSSDTNIASGTTYNLPASGTANFTSSAGYTTAAINTNYKDTTTTSYGSGSGKIGTYYNFCAATAGTYCYSKSSGAEKAYYDVCPKGWRLPSTSQTSGGDYIDLRLSYNSYADFREALSTPLSGGFYNGSAHSQGSMGLFLSNQGDEDFGEYIYFLEVEPNYVNTYWDDYRYKGFSMRCILDE